MICPKCHVEVPDGVDHCPNCNNKISIKHGGHTALGKASLILAIIPIICFIVIFGHFFSGIGYNNVLGFATRILLLLCFFLPIIAIILGVIAYFGKNKDKYGLIGFVLGICMIVIVPIGLVTITYFDEIEYWDSFPNIIFSKIDLSDTNNLTVVNADPTNLDWIDIELLVDGEAVDHSISGRVDTGDMLDITSIAGTGSYNISFRHLPTNTLLASFNFEAAS